MAFMSRGQAEALQYGTNSAGQTVSGNTSGYASSGAPAGQGSQMFGPMPAGMAANMASMNAAQGLSTSPTAGAAPGMASAGSGFQPRPMSQILGSGPSSTATPQGMNSNANSMMAARAQAFSPVGGNASMPNASAQMAPQGQPYQQAQGYGAGQMMQGGQLGQGPQGYGAGANTAMQQQQQQSMRSGFAPSGQGQRPNMPQRFPGLLAQMMMRRRSR